MTRPYRKHRPPLADGRRWCHDHNDGAGAYVHPELFPVYSGGRRPSYCKACKSARDARNHARQFAADPKTYERVQAEADRRRRRRRRKHRKERATLAAAALSLVDRGVLPSDAELARRLGVSHSTPGRWRHPRAGHKDREVPTGPTCRKIADLIVALSPGDQE